MLDPSSDAPLEVRHRLDVLQRVVIGQQLERQIAVKVVPPVLARTDECETLLLARIVVDLGRLQLTRHECDRLKTIAMILLECRADRVTTRVGVQRVRLRRVGDE